MRDWWRFLFVCAVALLLVAFVVGMIFGAPVPENAPLPQRQGPRDAPGREMAAQTDRLSYLLSPCARCHHHGGSARPPLFNPSRQWVAKMSDRLLREKIETMLDPEAPRFATSAAEAKLLRQALATLPPPHVRRTGDD